ncbi:MAG: ABC transporter permease [Devosia marina]|jgi:peptide/nickel transport system permease protein|uniref:ABC transporter permease subunit n=2 Tax=Devosia TaxID=46913 RepID=A0A7X3FU48_9HYPH|nr:MULTISPECIES: ABC transporter permease [Devosia]MBB4051249.1 peptide/nickel transport system permease protein [Devosia subaequoris]MCP1208087.1 ABC transporter permease [Devosia subaequoris]MVS99945.1 ABC transporter permease subunit [Devosia marina]
MGALVYIAKRFGLYLAVLFIGLSITFLLPRLMPINPVDGYIGQIQSRANGALSAEAIAELRENLENLYGLKGNLFTQYVDYMKRIVFSFDFGPSFTYFPQPVSQMLMAALPWTLSLLLTATVIAWTLGNLVGLVAGYFHKKKAASILEFVGILLYPIPYYILAVTVLLLLAYVFPVFPLSATFPVGQMSWEKVGMIIYNSLLPGITLVLAGFGWNILSMKALAVATTEEPYVIYARLKGASNWTRMTRYVFRNALLPQVTALALSLGMVFNGALLTEMIFSYPGIGLVMRAAATGGDYNVLYGAITISIIAVATAGLVIDLLYPLLDPRIRHK